MSIQQCRAVLSVVEHDSFAGAARAQGIAPSVVSMQISAFEERLGTMIFDRSTRPPKLTRAGHVVVDHARRIVSEFDTMRDELSLDFTRGATMRLGVIPTVLTNMLPAALILLRDFPSAPKVTVTSGLSGDLIWAAERGELDAALTHEPTMMGNDFTWLEVATQKVMLFAPADATETDPALLLTRHPYIKFNRLAWVAPLIDQRLRQMGVTPEPTAELQSIDAIRLLVRLGFGVSVIPSEGVEPATDGLKAIELGHPPLHRRIGFYIRKSLASRRITRIVVDAFRQAHRSHGEILGNLSTGIR